MGRTNIDEQSEYSQEEISYIEINTNTNADRQSDTYIPGTNIIDTQMNSQTMNRKNGQISRSNSIISIKEHSDDLILSRNNRIDEIYPKADTGIRAAKKQETELRAMDDTVNTFGVTDSFSAIQREDGKFMKQIKRYMAMYTSTYGIHEQKEILDNLISACRWYNATHWSYFGKSGKRLRDVKTILEKAKKERSAVIREISEEEKARVDRRNNREERREKLEEDYNLRFSTRESHTALYFNDTTDQAVTPISLKWAALKAYTVGLFGRNILNLGMGAVAGTAWLASYPFALLAAGITGNKKYYKGFNIKIPHPQSPKGWMKYYAYHRRHVWNAMFRYADKRRWWPLVYPGKFLQYNVWDPIKHLITLDVNHLSGGAYFGKDTKREAIKDRADADYRSAAVPVPDGYYEDDEEDSYSDRSLEEETIKEQLEDPALKHYAGNVLAGTVRGKRK